MAGELAPAVANGVVPRSTGTSTALATPAGTGAVGVANLSMVRMAALLEQAQRALKILQDVGIDLMREVTITEDMANYLTASLGERISLEQLRIISQMLTQIVDGSLQLVANGNEAVRAALVANFQVQVAQEALHSTGADGAYIDSQRRAG